MFTFKRRSPLVAVGIMLGAKTRRKPCVGRTGPQNQGREERQRGAAGSESHFPPNRKLSPIQAEVRLCRELRSNWTEEQVFMTEMQLPSLMMGENDHRCSRAVKLVPNEHGRTFVALIGLGGE